MPVFQAFFCFFIQNGPWMLFQISGWAYVPGDGVFLCHQCKFKGYGHCHQLCSCVVSSLVWGLRNIDIILCDEALVLDIWFHGQCNKLLVLFRLCATGVWVSVGVFVLGFVMSHPPFFVLFVVPIDLLHLLLFVEAFLPVF